MAKNLYEAKVWRDHQFFVVHVPGVGTTQARRANEVEYMARDMVALMCEVPADSFDLRIREVESAHEAGLDLDDEASS